MAMAKPLFRGRCYEPAQGTEQEGEAKQNLGFYNNNNIFINDLQVYIVI